MELGAAGKGMRDHREVGVYHTVGGEVGLEPDGNMRRPTGHHSMRRGFLSPGERWTALMMMSLTVADARWAQRYLTSMPRTILKAKSRCLRR